MNRNQPSMASGVGVELTRETIRYTMPASEAVLPAALARLTSIPSISPVLQSPSITDGRGTTEWPRRNLFYLRSAQCLECEHRSIQN